MRMTFTVDTEDNMTDHNRIEYKGFAIHEAYDAEKHEHIFYVQHPVTGAGVPCDSLDEVMETIDELVAESANKI